MRVYVSIFVIVLMVLGGTAWGENGVGGSNRADENSRIAQLEQRVQFLEEKLATAIQIIDYISYEENPINSLSGPHIIFSGVNIHVQSGAGTTGDINGLGNLIIGYNECPGRGDIPPSEVCERILEGRDGSHNLVVGDKHEYNSITGFVAGTENTITGEHASISGGRFNKASEYCASVSGGQSNTASEYSASVSGGSHNTASGDVASVSGGYYNEARGYRSSISGGRYNTTDGWYSSVSGGYNNEASGGSSNISGGYNNEASNNYSSVSGGRQNTASAQYSSVSGGFDNLASGNYSSVSGGRDNTASGWYSSVSGGYYRSATGYYDWVAGGLWQNQ